MLTIINYYGNIIISSANAKSVQKEHDLFPVARLTQTINKMNIVTISLFLYSAVSCFQSNSQHFDTTDGKGRVNPNFINKWLDEYFAVSGNRVPPRMFIDWIKLASENDCSIRPSDYKHIFEDLKPFKMPGMSKEYVNVATNIIEAYNREVLLVSKQDISEVSVKLPYHIGNSLDRVKGLLNPDLDFSLIIQYFDESMIIPSDDHSLAPYNGIDDVFERNKQFNDSFSEFRDDNSNLSVPNSFITIPAKFPVMAINRIRGFYDIIMPTRRTGLAVLSKDQRQAANFLSNWHQKLPRAIFRGASTGINFKEAKMKNIDVTANLRFKLHETSLQQREGRFNCTVKLDFAISKYLQFNGDDRDLRDLKEDYPEASSPYMMELFKSRYVVLVDGNGWPEKVAGVMLSGSLVFLATIHEDWVIRQLTEGVNYIKVKPDLSDLIEKLEWAYENDEEARSIAENGRQLALKKFDLNNLQVYNALLMMEYQNLFA